MELEAKRNKFITSLSSFLSVASPQIVACIWVSSKPLKDREKPFEWFNYIFNGVLESQIYNFKTLDKSIFKTEQFGGSLYLLQFEESYPQMEQAYKDFIQVLKTENHSTSTPQILVLSEKKVALKKWDSSFDHVEYFY